MVMAAVAQAVEEITSIYRSLPPRPSPQDVAAAAAVLASARAEEESRLASLAAAVRPQGISEELFAVLRSARTAQAHLRSLLEGKDAHFVLELDRRLQLFDDLVQAAQRIVCGDGAPLPITESKVHPDHAKGETTLESAAVAEKPADFKVPDVTNEIGLNSKCRRFVEDGTYHTTDGNEEKFSLIQVAGLIESSAKKGEKVLNLQGKLVDQMEWLPQSLGKLQDVNELNLADNRILALPASIGSLRSLTKFDIHSNQLTSLPDSFGELQNLVEADLHANGLKSLPSTFGKLASLVNLNLSSNQLRVLPDWLGNLTRLRRLNVETNELEELPHSIGSCISLVELRLDFNQLKALPEAVGKLVNLEILTLHYNRIRGLPTTMASLSRLRELDVSFNELELVPESLCLATSLLKLNIGKNFADLRALPRSIGNLDMLEELDISDDQIRVLPESFRFLTKLRMLNAEGTPLEMPPWDVVKQGAQAVVKYIADHAASTGKDGCEQDRSRQGFWSWLFSLFRACSSSPMPE